jgi:CBS domain-containing protein
MKNLLVSDIMTRELVSTSPDSNLLDCAKKMIKFRIGSLVIIDKNKRLVGFISQKDILWALTKKSYKDLTKVKAIEISPKKIAVIAPNCTIKEAIEKMNRLKFEKFPVVDKNKIVGFITARDIMTVHPEVYPEIEEFAKIREDSEKLKRIKDAKNRGEGICEECGNHGLLFKLDGRLVCESCKDEI